MCIVLKTAAVPDDYFGFEMKTVVTELLKLWILEVAISIMAVILRERP